MDNKFVHVCCIYNENELCLNKIIIQGQWIMSHIHICEMNVLKKQIFNVSLTTTTHV